MKFWLPFAMMLVSTSAVHSAELKELEKCASVQNDASRLNCFDANFSNSNVNERRQKAEDEEFQKIALIDLKLDIQKMRSKKVEVSGYMIIFAHTAMLAERPMDTNFIMIGYEKVPRDERRKLLQRCSTYCSVTIKGVVGNRMGLESIEALRISVD
jgi:hypothetical protein